MCVGLRRFFQLAFVSNSDISEATCEHVSSCFLLRLKASQRGSLVVSCELLYMAIVAVHFARSMHTSGSYPEKVAVFF